MTTEPDLFTLPELPYAGTSGWSGSGTSHERAARDDMSGATSERQQRVLSFLETRGSRGATWKELSDAHGWHHGKASGALSVLHKTGHINRLSERRDRCKVYVLPQHVNGRDIEPHGGSIQKGSSKQQEACMLSERQADVLIGGHDTLIHSVQRAITDEEIDDSRMQAERVIATVADWLTDYRPQEFGDEYCSPLDVTAFILRKGQMRD